ncbi:MAG: hypothetical protein LBN29_05030 [Mediterranea sp.]|jgi:hypothetical protein|nr:hypothetical protein [Mediterranea sp.]
MRLINKYLLAAALLANICLLAACGDVEEMGQPQPTKLRMEFTDYYAQITSENADGLAFVLRWTGTDTEKATIALGVEGTEQTVNLPNTSTLTNNDVREQAITNPDIIDALRTFAMLAPGTEQTLTLTLAGELAATVHVTLAPDLALPN